MKKYDVYCKMTLTYAEIIGHAYSHGEVLVLNNDDLKTHKKEAYRFYFEEGVLKSSLDDIVKEDSEDESLVNYPEDSPRAGFEYFKLDEHDVLIPYVSGTWKEIKDAVSEACVWIGGQGTLENTQSDPLKFDKFNILHELRIYEGSDLLLTLRGDVPTNCVGYSFGLRSLLPRTSFISPEKIDKAMKKWEKM